MSLPDFTRAEYDQNQRPIEGQVVDADGFVRPVAPAFGAFPLAILYGLGAALVGAVGYALVGLMHFMASIVTIGIGWLVARAMMTATRGVGGRNYQIAAVLLTYFSATLGLVIDIVHFSAPPGVPAIPFVLANVSILIQYLVAGPFMRLSNPFNGLLGLLILFFGLRTAWQLAAGTPGFGQAGGPRMGVFGVR